jgi:hypothetical protein
MEKKLKSDSPLRAATYSRSSDAEKYAEPHGSKERVEEQIRVALDGHPESELWGENGLIAATMRAANYASRQQEAEWKLADYLRGGGMLAEPADDGDVWEAGRSLPMCYCIDGQGRTILECVESISDAVMDGGTERMSQNPPKDVIEVASHDLLADGGPRIRRSGSRCGKCYWALYDGRRCQNPDCPAGEVDQWSRIVGLSNSEAQILIQANAKSDAPT